MMMHGDDDFRDDDQGDDNQSAKEASRAEFAKMLEDSFKKKSRKFSVGDKIRGEILVIGKEEVFVSIGPNLDGVVSRRDLVDADGNVPHKVGDMLDLFVIQVKGSNLTLSPKSTSKNFSNDLEDAFDMMLPVEGKVVEVCNGGFRVMVKGKLAFCPISHMDLQRIEQPDEYLGKKFEFRITKFEEGGRNIVVSRRKIMDEERELSAGSFATEHHVGDVVTGKIARLEKFGAFVELAPGIDGLLHVSQLSWTRVGDPSEVVQVGQEVQVKILKMESIEGRLRVSLSMKDSGADPWMMMSQKYPVGTVVSGKVERREPFGLFIKIGEGVTGLLHKSRAYDRADFAFDKLKVGDVVSVQVAEIRSDERRISLQVPKDAADEDWKGYAAEASKTAAALGTGFGTMADKLKAAMEKGKKK